MSTLSLQDLEDITMALRGQAYIARQDAEKNQGSSSASLFTAKAERLEALAARFERTLEARRTRTPDEFVDRVTDRLNEPDAHERLDAVLKARGKARQPPIAGDDAE